MSPDQTQPKQEPKPSQAAPGSPIIELAAVTKTYPSAGAGFTALKAIDLTIRAGEFVAIIGKSGSGKSTLLNMLTGIDHPTTGVVAIDGTEVHRLGESALAAWRGRHIGIVFQFFQLIPTLTILENLLLAMDFVGAVPKAERTRRAQILLAQVGITPQAHKLPAALSGGEQQRAAIARALANDPAIVVADEPTGNLDSRTAQVVQDLFRQLAAAGKTVIVVTHDSSVTTTFDRVITLKDGEVASDHGLARNREGGQP